MVNPRAFAMIETGLAVSFWGASFIATKVALLEVSPATVVWLRFLIGSLILGITMFLRRQAGVPHIRDLAYFALLGFIGITFHQWLQSTGLVTALASTTAWIVATTPIFMALLGWLILKEKLSWSTVLGISLAFVGVLLVVSAGEFHSISLGDFGTPGDFLILISAANWAVFSILSRRGLQVHPVIRMIFYVMAIGWIFSSIPFVVNSGPTELASLSPRGWSAIAFLGIFASGLAYIFWFDALHILPSAQVGAFLYFEPIVAMIAAGMILSEPLKLASLLGGLIILIGVWLVNRSMESSDKVR